MRELEIEREIERDYTLCFLFCNSQSISYIDITSLSCFNIIFVFETTYLFPNCFPVYY